MRQPERIGGRSATWSDCCLRDDIGQIQPLPRRRPGAGAVGPEARLVGILRSALARGRSTQSLHLPTYLVGRRLKAPARHNWLFHPMWRLQQFSSVRAPPSRCATLRSARAVRIARWASRVFRGSSPATRCISSARFCRSHRLIHVHGRTSPSRRAAGDGDEGGTDTPAHESAKAPATEWGSTAAPVATSADQL
jgi:hypothetical protein